MGFILGALLIFLTPVKEPNIEIWTGIPIGVTTKRIDKNTSDISILFKDGIIIESELKDKDIESLIFCPDSFNTFIFKDGRLIQIQILKGI